MIVTTAERIILRTDLNEGVGQVIVGRGWAQAQAHFSEFVSTSQQFVFCTPNLTSTADANEFASFPTSNSSYYDCWRCAEVRVKQSVNRLFQQISLG